MKVFAMIAVNSDGTRTLLWVKSLPADFDFDGWARSRQDAARVLGVAKFVVEEIAI